MEAFNNVKQVDNVQIPAELLYPTVQIKVRLGSFVVLQTASPAAREAPEVVGQRQAEIVAQSPLVHDHVEDVEELLALRFLADELLSVLSHVGHERLVFDFLLAFLPGLKLFRTFASRRVHFVRSAHAGKRCMKGRLFHYLLLFSAQLEIIGVGSEVSCFLRSHA